MTTPKPILPGITGPIWRDCDGDPWEEVGTDLLRYVGTESNGPSAANPRAVVERDWGPLTRETPRTWDLPPEPGPEVRAVRTASGILYMHTDEGWQWVHPPPRSSSSMSWRYIMADDLPLTDATADVQAEAQIS